MPKNRIQTHSPCPPCILSAGRKASPPRMSAPHHEMQAAPTVHSAQRNETTPL